MSGGLPCCRAERIRLGVRLFQQLLRFRTRLLQDLPGLFLCTCRVSGLCADGADIVICRRLRGLKHMVQLHGSLCDGTGLFQPDRAVLQLRLQRCILRLELVFALFERVNDLHQFRAAHPPQFPLCHIRFPFPCPSADLQVSPPVRRQDLRGIFRCRSGSRHLTRCFS